MTRAPDRLLETLEVLGWRGRIVSIDHLVDLKEAIRNRLEHGLLDEAFQKQVITRLLAQNSETHVEELLSLNPFLAKIGKTADEKKIIENNHNAVVRSYGMEQYRKKLLTVYAQVYRTAIQQRIDKNTLLAEFLDLTKFSLLKWGKYGV